MVRLNSTRAIKGLLSTRNFRQSWVSRKDLLYVVLPYIVKDYFRDSNS